MRAGLGVQERELQSVLTPTVRWAGERGVSRGAGRAVGLRHRGGEWRGAAMGWVGASGATRQRLGEGHARHSKQALGRFLQVASFSWYMPHARKQGWRCMV